MSHVLIDAQQNTTFVLHCVPPYVRCQLLL